MSAASTVQPHAPLRQRSGWRRIGLLPALFLLLLTTVLLGAGIGAVAVPPDVIGAILLRKIGILIDVPFSAQQEAIFWTIRLPRVLLGMLVGAGWQ